jgi:hypothetical protein
MTRAFGWIIVALVSLALHGCGAPAEVSVSRADVVTTVRPDGAIDVRETLHVVLAGAGTARFERRIPGRRADALEFQSASLDGTTLEPGASLDVEAGRDLRVVWTAVPANTPHVVELAYRARGAVAVRGARGLIQFAALPADRRYAIDRATVRLAVDASLHRFEGAGIAEAGWTVAHTEDGIAGERLNLPAVEGATFMAEVGIDTATLTEPAWQRYGDWSRDLQPAWIAGGLFMLVIGAGVLWIIRFQYPRPARGAPPFDEAQARERQGVRAGLRTTGLVSIVFSGVVGVVTWLTLSQFGWWPMSLAVSIFLIGVLFVAVARRIV